VTVLSFTAPRKRMRSCADCIKSRAGVALFSPSCFEGRILLTVRL